MITDKAARSFLSTRNEAILNRVLKAGEYVPESKFVSSTISDIVDIAKPKRKIGFVEAAKKRVKSAFSNFRRSKKSKAAPTDGRPKNASLEIEYKKKAQTPESPKRAQNAVASVKKSKPRKNPIKSGIKRAVKNVQKSISQVVAKNAGEYFSFSKRIEAAHRYLDTVVRPAIARKTAEVRGAAVRKFEENRMDYKRYLREFQDALKDYYKAVKKGDKVNLSFAESRLRDSKTSLEIAEKYMKLSEESCKNMAA